MNGKFEYDNKKIRWNFRIRKIHNYGYYNADSIITYKYSPFQIVPKCVIYKNGNYRDLIEFYNNKSDEEINKIIKDRIVQNYKFLMMENKFT